MMALGMLEVMRSSAGAWWRSLSAHELLALYTASDDTYYHAHYAHYSRDRENDGFPEAQSAYVLGHVAGFSPEYHGHSWNEIEPQLAHGWARVSTNPWSEVSDFAHAAFRRASSASRAAWRAWDAA